MSNQNGTGDDLPKKLVNQMQAIFGKHPGYRTTHAKGLLVEGTFTPTEEAKNLSIASHFHAPSTPVIARFSVGGGLPRVADTDPRATPKGVAIRFKTEGHTHTDMITHSFNGFATRTGEDFLTFLQLFFAFEVAKARKDSAAIQKAGAAFKTFLDGCPSAAVFVGSPKPNPYNYGTITYYEPNTHVLTNKDGKVTNVRYRLIPSDGEHLYTDEESKTLGADYLENDLKQRFPQKPIVITVQAQIAKSDDIIDDATIAFKSQTFVEVGKLEFNKVADDNAVKQQEIAFSPSPDKGGIKGIAPSSDPLIQARNGVYYISAEQRRNEKQVES